MKTLKNVCRRFWGIAVAVCIVTALAAINVLAAIDTPLIPLQPDSETTSATEEKTEARTEEKTEARTEEKTTQPDTQETDPRTEEPTVERISSGTTERSSEADPTGNSETTPTQGGANKKKGCKSTLSTPVSVIVLTVAAFACGVKRKKQ